MSLPCSGPISLYQVATEAGVPLGVSLGQTAVRNLAGVPSGPISMSQLLCKSAYSAIWSGSTIAYSMGIQTSGSSFREYNSLNGTVGAWATAYTTGSFSSTSSWSVLVNIGDMYWYAGFQTSGNALRGYNNGAYGGWIYFDKTSKWYGTQVTNANNRIYETSNGFIRANNANTYFGAWITLN